MANKNEHLGKAGKSKNDEFYTQLSDIEKELRHYKKHFKDKTIYCNCDDPYESNFFKYFAANFNALELKKLITTSYTKSPIVGGQLPLFEVEGLKPSGKEPFKIEINEVPDSNGDGAINLDDVKFLLQHNKNTATPLKGNGDFRSDECIELLKEADIVVTNPPFSLFREYVTQLADNDKKTLIIGNHNAITYKEVFKLLRDNRLWLGYTQPVAFVVPDYYEMREVRSWRDENGTNWRSLGNACWFTNLDIAKRHEDLIVYKTFEPEEYPKYDNYEAIEVSKVADIPVDYEGVMGVPITFLDKHNPKQFEIVGLIAGNIKGLAGIPSASGKDGPYLNGKLKYGRILIRKNKI